MDSNCASVDELTNEQRTLRNDIIRGLLRQLDLHAPGEMEHAERVSVYAVAAANELGLRGEKLQNLTYAAQLHDIGKLKVPSELLTSSDPLTEDERAIVNEHIHVRDILEEYGFLDVAIPLIEAHHERWDGRGYPKGSQGIEIPFGARIIAVSEVFDVMLHGAAWRPKFPEDAAIAALRGLTGSWFDPGIVDAVLTVHPLIQPHS